MNCISLCDIVSEFTGNNSFVAVDKNSTLVGHMHNVTAGDQGCGNQTVDSKFEPMYANTGIPMSI